VRKPSVHRYREVRVIAPETVEAIRARLEPLDATLISVLAYAGLRPWSEAVALSWDDVGEQALRVYAPKTRRSRSVRLLGPLRADLRAFRLASGRPPGRAPVFGTWGQHTPRAWSRRVWQPAVKAVGLPESTRPYDLRHSFASLLIAEGQTAVEVAAQLGHSPVMTLETYAHVFAEFEPGSRVPAEERIRGAGESRIGRDLALPAPNRPNRRPAGRLNRSSARRTGPST